MGLDCVTDLPVEATPTESVVNLCSQVDEVIRSGVLPPDLDRYLAVVVAIIG